MLSSSQELPVDTQSNVTQEQSSQTPYNGVVDFFGDKIKVVNGFGKYEEDEFYVSPDGSVVIDKERNLLGYVKDGEFFESDEEHHALLQQRGIELE